LAAQFDPSNEAATSARASFAAVFNTPAKRTKTINYCGSAIVAYTAQILRQTPEGLCEGQPSSGDAYEKAARWDMARAGAVLLLTELIGHRTLDAAGGADGAAAADASSGAEGAPVLAPTGPYEYDDMVCTLIGSKAVWQMADQVKESAARVRGAVHQLIAALAQHGAALLTAGDDRTQLKRLATTAFAGLGESADTAALRASWNACYQLVRYQPQIWAVLNVRKAVWPHLWGLIRAGGRGLHTVLFTSLASWVGRIPDGVLGEGVGFHAALWDALAAAKTRVAAGSVAGAGAAVRASSGGSGGSGGGGGGGGVGVILECERELFTHFLLRPAGLSAATAGGLWTVQQYVRCAFPPWILLC
jgi:hypothetical protein